MSQCETERFTLSPIDLPIEKTQADFGCVKSPNILTVTFKSNSNTPLLIDMLIKNVLIVQILLEYLEDERRYLIKSVTSVNPNVTVSTIRRTQIYTLTLNAGIDGLSWESNSKPRDYVPNDKYIISPSNPLFIRSDIILTFERDSHLEVQSISDGNRIIDSSSLNNPSLNNSLLSNNKCKQKSCNYNNISYCNNNNGCLNLNNCENVRVPAIIIRAQTNIDGSDLGDGNFQICDEMQYYDYDKEKIKGCKIRYIKTQDLKQTMFRENNLSIYNVLENKGSTACEKISNIFNENEIELEIDFVSFYENIITYVVVRYILSKLLYGDFNMNYLLQKYYKQFLKDLGSSRFCAFLEFFLDCNQFTYGYDKYFK